MMRVCLVDHAYHQRTRSTLFVKQDLLAEHEVDEWWDDRWHSGVAPDATEIIERGYDLIVVVQAEELLAELVAKGAENLVFIPMWDGARHLPDRYWRRVGTVRVLSFCHALHERLRRLGVVSTYAQFYPDPVGDLRVADFSTLRGFFWQRRFEITWKDVAELIRKAPFSGMHLHLAQDPNAETRNLPSKEEIALHNVTTSQWFETQEEYLKVLAGSNVFFAPRLSEGIGFSFIEAMAMGMCVVAVDQPTMSEYITDGVSGLLWPVGRPQPLDFSHAAELGRRAREGVHLGRERWLQDVSRLRDFIETPSDRITSSMRDYAPARGETTDLAASRSSLPALKAKPSHVQIAGYDQQGGLRTRGAIRRGREAEPLITVATVTLNCRDEFEDTITNILSQDYPNLEVIVVDGGSTDGTLEVIRKYEQHLDLWVSAADDGPFDAMQRAAGLARGAYLLFMNAGDWFIARNAVSQAFRNAPQGVDFVFGHHVYRRPDGVEELHKANNFENTWRRLLAGDVDGSWLTGVPGHQATFVRADLLRREGFDERYRIVADHEFMYRMRARGGSFFNADVVIAAYASGGLSSQNLERCFDEWEQVAAQYGGRKAARRLRRGLRRGRLSASRIQGVHKRLNPAKLIARPLQSKLAERQLRRSGMFFPDWYLETYPDVREASLDPVKHYVRHGAGELRNPSPFFDTRLYLSEYSDVARARVNPFLHYIRYGAAEGRSTGSAKLEGLSSQFGEDEFLLKHGHLPRKGVFVDVGAGDPVRFSNTHYLERSGWTGICIDADPKQVELLRRVRTCAVEWAAVGSSTGPVELLQCADHDYSTTLDHLYGIAAEKEWTYVRTFVPGMRLETILNKHGIDAIDLLSIDTEGTELEVCRSLDWNRHRPGVVVIEYLTDGRSSQELAVRDYFLRLPYRLIHRTASNLIFLESRVLHLFGRSAALHRYLATRDDLKLRPIDITAPQRSNRQSRSRC